MCYLQDIFYCDRAPVDIKTEYASLIDITFVRVEPNNICDRWEKNDNSRS